MLGKKFVLNKDIITRDGLIEKGTKGEVNEYSESDAEYKVYFEKECMLYDEVGYCSEWFPETELYCLGLH